MINETVNIDDLLDDGYIHYTLCCVSIAGKGSKNITMCVNLKTNEVVYYVYMSDVQKGKEKHLCDAVVIFNEIKLQGWTNETNNRNNNSGYYVYSAILANTLY